MIKKILGAFFALLISTTGVAYADSTASETQPGYLSATCPGGQHPPCFVPYNATNPLPVSGSFSATTTPFAPGGTGATATIASVTTGGQNVALPAGTAVIVSNTGSTNTIYVSLSVGAGSVTTANGIAIPAGGAVGLAVGSNTYLNAITATSTSSVNIIGGSGLVSGYGGGGGGSSGSNAAASATGSAVPASGSYNAVNVGGTLRGQTGSNPTGTTYSAHTDITSVAGATVGTGHGTASGAMRVELPSDGTGVVGLNAGTNVIGKTSQVDSGGTDATDTSNHAVRVNVVAGGGSGGTSSSFSAAFPATGTAIGAKNGSNMVNLTADASNNLNVNVQSSTGAPAATPTGSTTFSPVSANAATSCGGHSYANAQQQPFDMDLTGKLCVNGSFSNAPATSGGFSLKSLQVANNTTSVAVDASAGQLYGIEAFNNSATIAYIKLYNTAQGSTTCGSGTVIYRGMIPSTTNGAGYISMNAYGLPFSTAITACITTGYADSDTTAPAANAYIVNFFYK